MFDDEQVLVVADAHRFANADYVTPEQLGNEILIDHVPGRNGPVRHLQPVLTPAGIVPRRHQPIKTTGIMLQRVASRRGAAALPRWLADE